MLTTSSIDNPKASRCDARMRFADPDFLDVHFGFSFVDCTGSQVAEFIVPREAPNGDAIILWYYSWVIKMWCADLLVGSVPIAIRGNVATSQLQKGLQTARPLYMTKRVPLAV